MKGADGRGYVQSSWLPWLFRGFAFFQFVSALATLFVLVQTIQGPWLTRAVYIMQNEKLVMLSWGSSMLGILSMISMFSLLIGMLNPRFRLLLIWAWMVSLIGGVALFINHFIQMFLVPALSELFLLMPTERLLDHLHGWDQLLLPVMVVFGPTCIALCGLVFTAAMFKTKHFSSSFSWWSFAVWFVLLGSAISGRWFASAVPALQVTAIFIHVPWLWQMAERLHSPPESFVME